MIEQLHYYQASIELELLLLSSFDVLPLDFLAEISMKSITWDHDSKFVKKGGYRFKKQRYQPIILYTLVIGIIFCGLERRWPLQKKARGGLNIVLQEKNNEKTLLESLG